MFFLLFRSALSEENLITDGTYSRDGRFLPLIESGKVNAKLLLIDYPEKRIPIKRFMRVSAAFTSLSKDVYAFQELIGHIIDPADDQHFVWNMTSFGTSGRVSQEDTITHMHYAQLDSDMIPGSYKVDFYASLLDENNQNHSILLFNDTLTFYETIDYKYQIGSVVLYLLFAAILLGIVYFIFSKDQSKKTKMPQSKKSNIKDYSEIHNVSRSESPSSGSGRGSSPGRSASPKKGNK